MLSSSCVWYCRAMPQNAVQVLGPGLVLLQGALSPEQQRWLVEYALCAGARPKRGWYSAAGQLNATPSRGRIYDAIDNFPEADGIRGLCLDLVQQSRAAQPNIPQMHVTHMLLLLYTTAEGMGWHRDSDPNDGDNDHPIVSISLGNASDFGYKPLLRPECQVRLDSGDVVVWGGPQRMLEHSVLRVHEDSCPGHLQDLLKGARINFTFRSAPNILGQEAAYGTDTFWVDPT